MSRQTIALLNPPPLPSTTANREGAAGMGAVRDSPGGFVYPPQTLATTAAVLREAAHRVVVLDAVGESFDLAATVDRVAAHEPDMVGVFVSPATRGADVACLRSLRARLQATPLVACGSGSRFMTRELEATDLVHTILIGEPELAFSALVGAIRGADPQSRGPVWPADLHAAGYDKDGRLLALDALPHPAWDLLPRYPFYTLHAGRGCPDSCAYCPYVVAQGTTHRPRDPRRVADEMAWLAAHFSPPRLIFRDPVFAHDREQVVALCRELRNRRFDVPWECESRPEHFDAELLRSMKRAGCRVIKIGLETVEAGLLVQWRRVASESAAAAYVRHTAEVIRAAQKLAITVRLFVMVGVPGQTEQAARETARFVREARPNALHVMRFVPHPDLNLTGERPAAEGTAAHQAILAEVAQGLGDRPPARRWMFWRR